jgi:hypothetical protein
MPPFAAGYNAVIDDGNPIGWTSPQSLAEAVRGNGITAPMPQQRGWAEEARRLGAVPRLTATVGRPPEPTARVARDGPILMLAIGNEKILKLFDHGAFGAEYWRAHLFDTLLPDIGFYSVSVEQHEERFHYLISTTTGAMTTLFSRPVVAPDKQRALAWNDSQMMGRTLEVVHITPARAKPEKVAWEPEQDPDTAAYDIAWAPDGQAILITEANPRTQQRKTLRLVLKDGAWRRA